MKNQLSLRSKIFSYLIAFVFVMVFLLWIFQTVFLDNFYQFIKTKSLERAAAQIETVLNDASLQERIDSLSMDNEICIRVIQLVNTDYVPAVRQYASQNRSACAVARMSDEQILDTWQKANQSSGEVMEETIEMVPVHDPGSDRMIFRSTGNRDMIYARSIDSFHLILVSARISPVNSTVETLRVQLVFVALIICVLASLLAVFMTLKVTKPLEEIHRAARILATGNVDVQFNASGYKEINELNDTLNYAAHKLKEVDQMRRDLIANVSHDLRTPLCMIEGYSEMMRDLPGENTPENAQVIMDEAHRLTVLVNDLLDLSSLEEKNVTLELKSVNLSEVIGDVVSRIQKYAESLEFELHVEVEPNLHVQADVKRIEQILYNFIYNAIQYSFDYKRIDIRAFATNTHVHVEIQDYGEGIEEDKLDQIWDRYYKVDKAHVRASKGSGIGLSICRHLLELHHAHYGVHSKKQQGTTFWFELPKLL